VTGVLLMAHGTPASLDDLPEYLSNVRGGRPPSPALLAEMRHNYEAIGGRSPLTDITRLQAAALSARLGSDVPVAVGMRNWSPYLRDGIAELQAAGVTRIVAIPLAPQFSTVSVARYYDAARAALTGDMELIAVDTYAEHPLLIRAFAERVREARPAADEEIIFTAHSVPVRVVAAGDRYAVEVARTSRAVASELRLPRYRRAFQSAGRTAERWIGLDLAELVRIRSDRGSRRFLVVPIGFVCDHTEILYDIDVQARRAAAETGATLRRTASLNDSQTFISLLESIVRLRL
jgi:ferrochelatase